MTTEWNKDATEYEEARWKRLQKVAIEANDIYNNYDSYNDPPSGFDLIHQRVQEIARLHGFTKEEVDEEIMRQEQADDGPYP